jgi:hypothetical protein
VVPRAGVDDRVRGAVAGTNPIVEFRVRGRTHPGGVSAALTARAGLVGDHCPIIPTPRPGATPVRPPRDRAPTWCAMVPPRQPGSAHRLCGPAQRLLLAGLVETHAATLGLKLRPGKRKSSPGDASLIVACEVAASGTRPAPPATRAARRAHGPIRARQLYPDRHPDRIPVVLV